MTETFTRLVSQIVTYLDLPVRGLLNTTSEGLYVLNFEFG